MPGTRTQPIVALADEAPELFTAGRSAEPAARAASVARVIALEPGASVCEPEIRVGALGLFVLNGFLAREFALAGRRSAELVGEGDLVGPHEHPDPDRSIGLEARWRALSSLRLAILDGAFVARTAAYPEMITGLSMRTARRARRLAIQCTARSVRRVDARLLMLFSLFAEEWGQVRSDGVHVPIPLNHRDLARMVGSERPAVSMAVGRLAQRRELMREPDRSWLIGVVPEEPGSRLADRALPVPAAARVTSG